MSEGEHLLPQLINLASQVLILILQVRSVSFKIADPLFLLLT